MNAGPRDQSGGPAPWVSHQGHASTWNAIRATGLPVDRLLQGVTQSARQKAPRTWAMMSTSDRRRSRDAILIRHVTLLAELAGWPNRANEEVLLGALVCHFLWGCVWRTCDDVLDESALDRQGFGRALSALVDATASTFELTGTHADYRSLRDDLSLHISSMVIASMREFGNGLPLNRLPDRAAPFFIVPEVLLKLPKAEIDLYRHAIRLDGIAHDSHDLLDDVEKGVASLPRKWMKHIDAGASFRPSVVAALFGKVEEMLRREFLAVRKLSSGKPRPVLEALLQEIDDVRREFASAATIARVGSRKD